MKIPKFADIGGAIVEESINEAKGLFAHKSPIRIDLNNQLFFLALVLDNLCKALPLIFNQLHFFHKLLIHCIGWVDLLVVVLLGRVVYMDNMVR